MEYTVLPTHGIHIVEWLEVKPWVREHDPARVGHQWCDSISLGLQDNLLIQAFQPTKRWEIFGYF